MKDRACDSVEKFLAIYEKCVRRLLRLICSRSMYYELRRYHNEKIFEIQMFRTLVKEKVERALNWTYKSHQTLSNERKQWKHGTAACKSEEFPTMIRFESNFWLKRKSWQICKLRHKTEDSNQTHLFLSLEM